MTEDKKSELGIILSLGLSKRAYCNNSEEYLDFIKSVTSSLVSSPSVNLVLLLSALAIKWSRSKLLSWVISSIGEPKQSSTIDLACLII